MILALDVGNTNITCGVFDGDRIKASFRITTKMPRTSDEYGMLLSTLLERNQVGMDDIHDAIICSVVPNIMHSLQNGLIKYFNIRPKSWRRASKQASVSPHQIRSKLAQTV